MKQVRWLGGLVAVLLFCSATLPAAGAPAVWLSAPSVATFGQSIEIKGGNLPANAAMVLKVVGPDALETAVYVTADASGNIQAPYVVGAAGGYKVQLVDGGGAPVASSAFVCAAQ